MTNGKTVQVNGRTYDAKTGLPVTAEPATRSSRAALRDTKPVTAKTTPVSAPVKQQSARTTTATKSQSIHQRAQKSTTLNRTFTKKPVAKKTAHTIQSTSRPRIDGMRPITSKQGSARHSLAAKKPATNITPAATKPVIQKPTQTKQVQDTISRPHPVVARAHQVQAARKTQTQVAAAPIKQQAKKPAATQPASQTIVQQALKNAPSPHEAKPHKTKRMPNRFAGALFGCMALVLFGGYVTYLNVPNLSTRVAAAQAGIDASYPSYQPDGYKLNGPVAYSDGQVRMKFAANTGNSQFTLNQKSSSWDSSALLDNYVKEKSDGDYSTSQEKGLTVYNYDSNAAWVSGGIIYTIEGDAPLSPDQIRKIATSI